MKAMEYYLIVGSLRIESSEKFGKRFDVEVYILSWTVRILI